MPPPPARPSSFSYDEERQALLIGWSDGARHSIPFAVLRRACPCAICSGELGSGGRFATDPELRPGEDDLADIRLVGSYGVNPIWADGHDTGILTFENLRRLGSAPSS